MTPSLYKSKARPRVYHTLSLKQLYVLKHTPNPVPGSDYHPDATSPMQTLCWPGRPMPVSPLWPSKHVSDDHLTLGYQKCFHWHCLITSLRHSETFESPPVTSIKTSLVTTAPTCCYSQNIIRIFLIKFPLPTLKWIFKWVTHHWKFWCWAINMAQVFIIISGKL
jgi:hypothetical protein